MKYLLTIQKEKSITNNEYPYNNKGFETVIENYIGGDDWTEYISYGEIILGVFPLTEEQAKSLPYDSI